MATGYSRQSSGVIINGGTIQASHFNNEFNAILDFVNATTGHSHDGTAGGGAPISLTSSVTGTLPVANGGTGGATAAAARTALGLAIGTDVQAYDAELAALAGLTSAADKGIMFTGAGTAAVYTLTAAGLALLDDAAASNQRTTLGLGTIATQDSSNVSISGGTITGGSISGITDLAVADGGTGASSAADARTNLSAAALSQPDFFTVTIETPQSKTYPIITKAPVGFTITNVTAKSSAGTCTATTKIDTVALGGTANSVSTTEDPQTHASVNAVAVGADLTVTLASVSSAADVNLTYTITRTLS